MASAATAMRPDMILLHYTGMIDPAVALDRLCAAGSEVSAHYLVLEDGRVMQMVPESPPRLARGRFVLGGRDRYQFLLDRH